MILFLDTVSPSPEFCVIKDDKVIQSIQILNKNSKKISDCIIPAYLKLHNHLNMYDKIEKLVVCTGPGSFTALRVGIAFMYGISITKNIPLIGIPCTTLLEFSTQNLERKKTLMIICSSNDQNFIAVSSNGSEKYLIEKIDIKHYSTKFDCKKYSRCVSNFKLSSDIMKIFGTNICQQIDLAEIVRLNLNKILLVPKKLFIEPIYISDNKILN